MNKMDSEKKTPKTPKLFLNRETLRTLSAQILADVVGGATRPPTSEDACPSSADACPTTVF